MPWKICGLLWSACHAAALLLIAPVPVRAEALWTTLPAQPDQPPTYSGSLLVRDSRRDRFIGFAGAYRILIHGASTTYNTTTWSLDLADTLQPWRRLPSATGSPALESACAVYDSISDKIFVFGGWRARDNAIPLIGWNRSLQVLSLAADGAWQSIAIPPEGPPALEGAGLVVDPIRRRLLIFGGRDSMNVPQATLWAYGLDTGLWTNITPAVAGPAPRWQALVVLDPVHDCVFVAGGNTGTFTTASDTWRLILSGAPQWEELDSGAPLAAGILGGVLDADRGRLIGLKDQVIEFPLDGTGTWRALATTGGGVDVTARYPVVMDPLRATIVVPWTSCCSGATSTTHLLHLGPLASVHLTAVLDSTTYWTGTATAHWTIATDRPLYQRPIVTSRTTPGEAIAWRTDGAGTGMPDPQGRLNASAPLAAGRGLELSVEWFDGSSLQHSTWTRIETPPAPVSTTVRLDTLHARGGVVHGTAIVAGDSTRWLAPMQVESRSGAGSWTPFVDGFPDTAMRLAWIDPKVERLVTYHYRLAWGPAEARRQGAEWTITIPPIPERQSVQVTADSVVFTWSMAAGFPLRGTFYRGTPDGLVPLGPVTSDVNGIARFADYTVTGSAHFDYYLGWDDGGVEAFLPGLGVDTPPRNPPPPPPPPGAPEFALLPPHPNPASGQAHFSFTLADSVASRPARLELLDLTGRLRWSAAASGSGLQQFDLATSGLPEGLYFLRLTQNGVSRQRRITLLH